MSVEGASRTTLWVSIAATVFVLATAIFTGNPGLYILAGLSAAGSIGLLARRRRD